MTTVFPVRDWRSSVERLSQPTAGTEVFLAGDVEAAFLPQADGEDGRVVGVEQALQGDVAGPR